MKQALTLLSVCLFTLFTGCQSIQIDEPKSMETDWLPLEKFSTTLARLEKKQNGKNFWDEGHWITSVDGRWNDGRTEYRISYSEVPENEGYWWYWWFDQDEKSFKAHMKEYANKGFTMVHSQTFEMPTGEKKHQGVWHKIIQKESNQAEVTTP